MAGSKKNIEEAQMIIWIRRLTIILTGILFLALFLPAGKAWAGIIGLILNLVLLIPWRGFFLQVMPSFILILNTGLLIYGIFCEGNLVWALLAAIISLFAWNTCLFLSRWPQAPPEVQKQYLRRIGILLILGVGVSLSNIFAQGKLVLAFLPAFFLMLVAGVSLIKLLGEARAKRNK